MYIQLYHLCGESWVACLLPSKALRSATVAKSRQGCHPWHFPPGWDTVKNPRKLPLAAVGRHGTQARRSKRPTGTHGLRLDLAWTSPGRSRSCLISPAWGSDAEYHRREVSWLPWTFRALGQRWRTGGSPRRFPKLFPPVWAQRRRMLPRGGTVVLGTRKGRPAPQGSGERAAGLPHRPHPGPSLSPTNHRACPGA